MLALGSAVAFGGSGTAAKPLIEAGLDPLHVVWLRVVGAGMIRAECRVVVRTDSRVELEVAERVAPAWAVCPAGATRLPRDELSRHRVVLDAAEGPWRIASVR